jgi:hypothetical protein
MAKSKEPFGATAGAIIAGAFILVVDKLVPIEHFAGEFSNLLRVFFGAMMVVFAWQARRYYEILGGADENHGCGARDAYDSLRQGLTEGGRPAKVYANWLKLALHKVDKFFGDAGRNDRSWLARMLDLETPGPRWTAPAFDKCLLLALIYPVLTIYAVWIWSGEVGVAEEAFWLPLFVQGGIFRPLARAFRSGIGHPNLWLVAPDASGRLDTATSVVCCRWRWRWRCRCRWRWRWRCCWRWHWRCC